MSVISFFCDDARSDYCTVLLEAARWPLATRRQKWDTGARVYHKTFHCFSRGWYNELAIEAGPPGGSCACAMEIHGDLH